MRSGLMNEQNKRKHIIGQLAELRSSNDKLIQIARSIVVYGAQIRCLRSRVDSSARVSGALIVTSSASTWSEKSGRSPLSSIDRRASFFKIERCCLSFLSVMPSLIKDLPCSVPSKFHLFVKNRLHHFRCDNVKHDNYHYEQKERNRQPAKSKNLTKRREGHNHRHDNSQ